MDASANKKGNVEMTITWYELETPDRQSGAMLAYLLCSCQNYKRWVYHRITEGHRKPGGIAGTREETQRRWLTDYRRQNEIVSSVPKESLLIAAAQIWQEGSRRPPNQRKDWQSVTLPPRVGWGRYLARHRSVTWSDWLKGERGSVTTPRVTASRAAQELFGDEAVIVLSWGRVRLTKTSIHSLRRELDRLGLTDEIWFTILTSLTFVQRTDGRWQISFTVKSTEERGEDGAE